MVSDEYMKVEVAYAKPDEQRIVSVTVEKGSTIEEIIHLSGMLVLFPEIDLTTQKVGVFGSQKKLSDEVSDGDRIEIYRALIIDPKEARRAKEKKDKVKKKRGN